MRFKSAPLVFVSIYCWFFLARASAQSVPHDFKLHAHFTPGGLPDFAQPHWNEMTAKPWDLVIRGDGKVTLDVFKTVLRGDTVDSKRVRTSFRLSASQLSALISAVRKADFFSLPQTIPPNPELHHARVLYLSVQLNGSKREVRVFHPASVRASRAATRAKRLWTVLLHQLPSPNQNVELQVFY
jgi:hypothetical protein